VERAVILSEGDVLGLADFPFVETEMPQEPAVNVSRLDMVERAAIVRALEKHKNNVSRAAEALGLTRASLYRRMEKYGL
jgi:transcriptional regulator of acetoin/glycerol metabolism